MNKLPPHKVAGWKGYTLEEIRYQEAYMAAKLQIQREMLLKEAGGLKSHWFSPLGNSLFGRVGTLMEYAGYGIAAYRFMRQAIDLMKKVKK